VLFSRVGPKQNGEFSAWIANTSTAPLKKQRAPIKDTAGKVTDDKKLQTEGKFDKAKGSAHNVAGDIKDAVKQSNKQHLTRELATRSHERPFYEREKAGRVAHLRSPGMLGLS
jgi:uncharacterized protein YjbJ (UPF0337 family)